jgi:hypothetical protein
MNKLELRTQFAKLSGRYDLVTAAYADNGADFFIQAGQRFLDRLIQTPKSTARTFVLLEQSKTTVVFKNCRAIKRVRVADTDARTELEKKDLTWMREQYPGLLGSISQGIPLYYCPAVLRMNPETKLAPLGSTALYLGYGYDVMVGDHSEYNGVLMMPPADKDYMVEVEGLFYTPYLGAEDDENYWSINHPNILIMAAIREIEVFNRNSEGMRDWMTSIMEEFKGLESDLVETTSEDDEGMAG